MGSLSPLRPSNERRWGHSTTGAVARPAGTQSNMRRFCFWVFLFCFVPALAQAQVSRPKAPPLASVEAVPVGGGKPGATVELVVNVTPREGIHIYAPPQKEFKPILLTLDASPGVKVGKPRFPPAGTRTFEGEAIKVYDRAFSITVPVVLPRQAHGRTSVTGRLLYQACDDLVCYRPITVPLRWDIQIQ